MDSQQLCTHCKYFGRCLWNFWMVINRVLTSKKNALNLNWLEKKRQLCVFFSFFYYKMLDVIVGAKIIWKEFSSRHQRDILSFWCLIFSKMWNLNMKINSLRPIDTSKQQVVTPVYFSGGLAEALLLVLAVLALESLCGRCPCEQAQLSTVCFCLSDLTMSNFSAGI